MRNVKNIARLVGGVCLAGLSLPVAAQNAPGTITGLGNFSLPSSQPTPTPTPTPGPPPIVPPVSVTPTAPPRTAPTPTPTPTVPTPRSTPSTPAITLPTLRPAAPTPRAAAPRPAPVAPAPAPVETPLTTPAVTPSAVAPAPAETPAATPSVAPTPPAEPGLPAWLIPAALVGLAVLIGGVIALRRRRRATTEWDEPVAYDAPEPEPLPPAPEPQAPAAAPSPRFLTPPPPPAPVVLPSSLTIDTPSVRRAGINLITATADVSVVLRNDGAEPLRNIRVEIRLTSAQPGQDAALAALFAGPIERLFTPAFDLAPGEEKTVRTLSTMARDAITVLQAGERPMFVPVVAVRAIATGPDGEGQAMAAYALGVERAGSDKLGPFWLDQPPRMYDNIGVRPHAVRR